ncbi:MAG: hypothetical protein R2873_11685 [Caldilineaceae bacterium]
MTTTTLDRPLVSNGFTLPPHILGRLQPSDPSTPIEDLRAQYRPGLPVAQTFPPP